MISQEELTVTADLFREYLPDPNSYGLSFLQWLDNQRIPTKLIDVAKNVTQAHIESAPIETRIAFLTWINLQRVSTLYTFQEVIRARREYLDHAGLESFEEFMKTTFKKD